MPLVPSGAGDLANDLLASLIAGKDFSIPDININDDLFGQPETTGVAYGAITPIATDDLTTGLVDGTGVFDRLMTSLVNHLKVEYTANRISGAEYTKAYIGVVGAALQTSSQFLLGKDQAYWAAVLAQAQVRAAEIATITARIELETARVVQIRAKYEAVTAEANYGLVKIKIASEDQGMYLQQAQIAMTEAQKDGVIYNTEQILPAQKEGILKSNENLGYTGIGLDFNNTDILPKQSLQLTAQIAATEAQTDGVVYTNENLLPKQLDLAEAQIDVQENQATGIGLTNTTIIPKQAGLLAEQIEVQRAQTLDTRVDGSTVVGAVGKQKALYTQQVDSYKRDAETKAVKLYTDAWITQATLVEGTLIPPTQFSNTQIDIVLGRLRANLALTT